MIAFDERDRMKSEFTAIPFALCLMLTFQSASAQPLSSRLKSESAQTLAADAREKGNAIRGSILFTNQKVGCTQCHVAGSRDLLGPDLTRFEKKQPDVFFVEALLEPSKVIRKGFETTAISTLSGKVITGRIIDQNDKQIVLRDSSPERRLITILRSDIDEIAPSQKSSMPDNLVDQLKNRNEFLDVLRYVFELSSTASSHPAHQHSPGGESISPELQGLVLLKEFNCEACHATNGTMGNPVAEKQAPNLAWSGGRIDPQYIQRYLTNPHEAKPGTTMPDVMSHLDSEQRTTAAHEITHYLTSLSDRTFSRQPLDAKSAQRGRELFHSVGCVACHSPRDRTGKETLAETSVALGPINQKYNLNGLSTFLEKPHEVRPSGRMPNMQLTHWEAFDLANYLLSDGAELESDSDGAFALDPQFVSRGKQRFTEFGCVQCHHINGTQIKPTALPLAMVDVKRGCLSTDAGPWPKYVIKDDQRTALQAALKRTSNDFSSQDVIDLNLTAMRCLNCHQRDNLGGVSAARNHHFQTTNMNLGPQGRIPPPLTNVGAKLNPKWMRQVLVSGRSIRPYMKTRMPQFGTGNVAPLVELFQKEDDLPTIKHGTFSDQKEIRKVGEELVGTVGLNCIVCHTFQLKQSANMSAVDLTEMAERLQKDWFYHYMRDPQRLSMNTVMPSFWPGGKAMRKDVLNGETDQQIEAIWQYLLDGRQARTPRGLIRKPIELLATDEAVMLRRSYPSIGKRGIGVGYPLQVNIGFDAEQLRLAMVWKGKFADPGGVWRSQGHGTVRPLGSRPLQFPKGPDLDDAKSRWIANDDRPPHHQFKGYSLDDKQRPTFRYVFKDVAIEDRFVDQIQAEEKVPFLQRTITLVPNGAAAHMTFRAAEGKTIVHEKSSTYLVDQSMRIRFPRKTTVEIIDVPTGKQLRVPIKVTDTKVTLVVDYIW